MSRFGGPILANELDCGGIPGLAAAAPHPMEHDDKPTPNGHDQTRNRRAGAQAEAQKPGPHQHQSSHNAQDRGALLAAAASPAVGARCGLDLAVERFEVLRREAETRASGAAESTGGTGVGQLEHLEGPNGQVSNPIHDTYPHARFT